MPNYSNVQDLINKAEKWQLVDCIFLLLKLFFFKKCSKYNALLSSVISHARSLTKFVKYYVIWDLSNVLKLYPNISERFPKYFYTNNDNLNLNDNKLLLVTTAVKSRYQLSAFLSISKQVSSWNWMLWSISGLRLI